MAMVATTLNPMINDDCDEDAADDDANVWEHYKFVSACASQKQTHQFSAEMRRLWREGSRRAYLGSMPSRRSGASASPVR